MKPQHTTTKERSECCNAKVDVCWDDDFEGDSKSKTPPPGATCNYFCKKCLKICGIIYTTALSRLIEERERKFKSKFGENYFLLNGGEKCACFKDTKDYNRETSKALIEEVMRMVDKRQKEDDEDILGISKSALMILGKTKFDELKNVNEQLKKDRNSFKQELQKTLDSLK